MSRQSIPAAAGMEVLKRELQRKRQLLDADFGGRKIVRRDEIEAREIQRIREAERLQKQLRGSSEGSRGPPRRSAPHPPSPRETTRRGRKTVRTTRLGRSRGRRPAAASHALWRE
jgi:hypothetical protein